MTDVSERKRSERAQPRCSASPRPQAPRARCTICFRSIHECVATLMPAKNFYIALSEPDDDTASFPTSWTSATPTRRWGA